MRLTIRPIALPIRTPSSPPTLVRTAASIRNCTRISRRRAPIALRTPISRVRSVTEMVMIAMTPMPPTISAIDEITTSDEQDRRGDLIPDRDDRVPGDEIEIVRLVERQAVADAHDRLDLAHRILARHAFLAVAPRPWQ